MCVTMMVFCVCVNDTFCILEYNCGKATCDEHKYTPLKSHCTLSQMLLILKYLSSIWFGIITHNWIPEHQVSESTLSEDNMTEFVIACVVCALWHFPTKSDTRSSFASLSLQMDM